MEKETADWWRLGVGDWGLGREESKPEVWAGGWEKRILFLDERSQKVLWNQQKCTVTLAPQPVEQGKKVEDSMDEVKTTVEGSKGRKIEGDDFAAGAFEGYTYNGLA